MIANAPTLATGARWGEAEGLRVSHIRDGLIQFVQTKSSKARSAPITATLESELISHHKVQGEGDRLFKAAYEAFRDGVKLAKLILPKDSSRTFCDIHSQVTS